MDYTTIYGRYNSVAEKYNIIIVNLKGMDDYTEPGTSTKFYSWNCSVSKESHCSNDTQPACYDSCAALDLCNRCSWHTCYDDVAFTNSVIQAMIDEYSVNPDLVMLGGESNGGMFTYYASGKTRAKYFLPVYGNLKVGEYPMVLPETALMSLRGRTNSGSYYTTTQQQVDHWSQELGCDLQENIEILEVPHSGGVYNLQCFYRPSCQTVVWCEFDGYDGVFIWQQPEIHAWFVFEFLNSASNTLLYKFSGILLIINIFLK